MAKTKITNVKRNVIMPRNRIKSNRNRECTNMPGIYTVYTGGDYFNRESVD